MNHRPNILLILADSAQPHVYGCYGGMARTPRADRLAAEGMRFERAYTTAPICHPARSVIDTGLFPHANGMITNRCGRGAYPFQVFPHVPSLAALLSAAGYRTGYAGQGHIDVRGFHDDRSYPTPEFHAWLRGQGLEEAAIEGYRFRGCGRLRGGLETARDTQFARLAVELIEEYAGLSDRPWFIQCDFDGPHPPCLVPAPFDSEYDPAAMPLPASLRDPLDDVPPAVRNARDAQGGGSWSDDDWRRYLAYFYAMTTVIDELVGRVLGALDRHGLAERTLVLFTSDHAGMMGAHGFVMHGSPALYDPVMRVPFLVHWPSRVQPGAASDAFLLHTDLMPTLVEVAGGEPPVTHGRSFLPLLAPPPPQAPPTLGGPQGGPQGGSQGGQPADWREDVYAQYHGDGVQFYTERAVRSQEWSYIFAPHGGEQLYDLRSDPDERRNRAGEPSARGALRQMRERLAAWMEQVDDPLRHASIWRKQRSEE
jgi:arylsulfatase A-like enzyme